jgi:hypothetical protein
MARMTMRNHRCHEGLATHLTENRVHTVLSIVQSTCASRCKRYWWELSSLDVRADWVADLVLLGLR